MVFLKTAVILHMTSLYYIGTCYRKLRVAKRTRKFRKKRWYMVYCVKNANIFCHMSPLYSSGFSHVFVRLEIVWTVQQVWRPSRIVKVVNNVKASKRYWIPVYDSLRRLKQTATNKRQSYIYYFSIVLLRTCTNQRLVTDKGSLT